MRRVIDWVLPSAPVNKNSVPCGLAQVSRVRIQWPSVLRSTQLPSSNPSGDGEVASPSPCASGSAVVVPGGASASVGDRVPAPASRGALQEIVPYYYAYYYYYHHYDYYDYRFCSYYCCCCCCYDHYYYYYY